MRRDWSWPLLLIGLIGLILTGWWAVYESQSRATALQAKLQTAADAVLADADLPDVTVTLDGQKAILTGTAPDAATRSAIASRVLSAAGVGGVSLGGVTVVDNQITIAEPEIAPEPVEMNGFVWTALIDESGLTLSGLVPDEAIKAEIVALARSTFPGQVTDLLQVGDVGADLGWLDWVRKGLPNFAKFNSGQMSFGTEQGFVFTGTTTQSPFDFLSQDFAAPELVYGLDTTGVSIVAPDLAEIEGIDLTVADNAQACETAIAAVLVENKIFFGTNSDVITRESGVALDKIAAIKGQCPDVAFEVGGHTDTRGHPAYNIDLSQRRAQSVVNYLVDKGFPREGLSAVGYGADRPKVSNDTAEGMAENRRIEFTVRREGDR
jgi:outer membrane protein OmpA-like peptidoglycan-associated protein